MKENLVAYFTATHVVPLSAAEQIAEQFEHKVILKNEFQLTAGKICDEYLFLQYGHMRAFAIDTEGRDVTTNFCSTGQIIFEVSSFFNRTRSQENIQALTDCQGWQISYEQLNHLFHTMPAFREFGRSVLVKGFAALKTRMLSMITETAEQRYEWLLKTNPEIFMYAPLKNIASFLGITDTSLSRIRKDISKKH